MTSVAMSPTAGNAASATPLNGMTRSMFASDCISDIRLSHSVRTVGSVMAKGPPMQRGSRLRPAAAASAATARRAAARRHGGCGTASKLIAASPSDAATTAAVELMASSSQTLTVQ
jgi:hypothetical protein